MAYENSAGIDVFNHYGPRDTGNTVGVERSTDSIHQLSLELTGESVNSGFLPPFVIPVGAHFLRYILHVDEVFTGGGSVTVGQKGAEATNGIPLSAANLGTVATLVLDTATGTWATDSATGVTTAAEVGVAVTGTITEGVGQATLIAEYVYKNRTVS